MHDRLCRTLLSAMLALALAVAAGLAGCGKDRASEPEAASPNEKTVADPENPDVPQPINAWGEFVGDDVLLHWLDGAEGDYNVDGTVDGKDVFPLALRFNKPTDYSDSQQAEQPLDNCIDGNRDGTLDGLDLFTIAVHFNEEVRGYRLYDSLDGAEAAELTTAEIDRESGVGLCRPEHEWTAEGKALEDGLHVFYLTAVAEYKQPSADEGTAVTLDVRNEPGFPQGAIWPARYHDRRNSYRSQFKGPREYDPDTTEYLTWSNQTAYPIRWLAGNSDKAVLGFTAKDDYDIDFELSEFDMNEGTFGWDSGDTSARDGTYDLLMLDSGGLLHLSRQDSNDFDLYRISSDGVVIDAITLPAELGTEAVGTCAVTVSQNLFLRYRIGELYSWALWTLDGDEAWNVPIEGPHVNYQTPPLVLSNGLIVVSNNGNLVALRENDHGEEWSFPIVANPDDVDKIEIGFSADSEDNVYFWVYLDLYSETDQLGMYGVISPEGEDISCSGIVVGRIDQFVTLDDGTALLLYKESGGFNGYYKRVFADTLEPLWEKSDNLYSLLAIDSERYLYLSSVTGNIHCFSPDGDLIFSAPYCFGAFIGSNGDLFAIDRIGSSIMRIPGLSHVVN